MTAFAPFHIAFPVDDLDAARQFYGSVMGCPEGRSSEEWIYFKLFGNQIVAHRVDKLDADTKRGDSAVGGVHVPVPHFGVVLPPAEWQALADRLKTHGVAFLIEPYTRFKGAPGEQSTMFFLDPAGNALEFKAFADMDGLFAK